MLLLLTLAVLAVWVTWAWLRYRRVRRMRQDWERQARHQERAVQSASRPRSGHVQHLGPR